VTSIFLELFGSLSFVQFDEICCHVVSCLLERPKWQRYPVWNWGPQCDFGFGSCCCKFSRWMQSHSHLHCLIYLQFTLVCGYIKDLLSLFCTWIANCHNIVESSNFFGYWLDMSLSSFIVFHIYANFPLSGHWFICVLNSCHDFNDFIEYFDIW
jgi:hypothetical protein